MATVDEWFPGFAKRHMARHHREDWPKGPTGVVFFQGWVYSFLARGVEERHAERASLELVAEPPAFLSDHLPAIVRLAREYRRRDEEPPVRASLEAPGEDSPEKLQALADLKALVGSLGRSRRSRCPFTPPRPRKPPGGEARAVPAAAYLADAIPDPVIRAERARAAPSQPSRPDDITIPEDDESLGWF
jgi:hypothetical protein